jgi:2-methylcitrate dehydratase PrpD
MPADITTTLSTFASTLTLPQLPPEVPHRARLLLLDLIGNIIRARHDAESTPSFLHAVQSLGLTIGTSRVFGDDHAYSPLGAAFLNGALAHSLDFDDTHAAGSLHPGAPVIPAALAAGEMTNASGAEVLAAIIAGYEITCRIALALPAHAHYDRGFHPTATCGAFGAAAAAARVFRLNAEQTAGALGTVLSQCAGSLEFLVNGAWTKRSQVGWAACNGLVAATLVREGFKGAAEAIEGPHGFLRAYAPDPSPERAIHELGQTFELLNTAVKPYPSCRYGHPAIDAALALRNDLASAEIQSVTIGLPRSGMMLIAEPADKKANPQNTVDGQFSGPFVVACALATGQMSWDSYQRLNDPSIRVLLPKITCQEDPELPNMAAKLTIRARGATHSKLVTTPKGEPDNFLTEQELRAKFHSLTDPILGADRADLLADRVLAIREVPDLSTLHRYAAPAAPKIRLAGD